jgi:dihydrofolate reductase
MINSIVAVDKQSGIGFLGKLPWPHLKNDMKFFKSQTENNFVIMGSTTWRSLPNKLPNRINCVISRFKHDADLCFSALEASIFFAKKNHPEKEIFIIGGEKLYNSSMDIIDNFYVTEIDQSFNCDRFFNLDFVKNNYKNTSIISSHIDNDISYTIKKYSK